MENPVKQIKGTVSNSYGGAAIGGIIGWSLSKWAGYEKSISVISFTLVGALIGATIGYKLKNK